MDIEHSKIISLQRYLKNKKIAGPKIFRKKTFQLEQSIQDNVKERVMIFAEFIKKNMEWVAVTSVGTAVLTSYFLMCHLIDYISSQFIK